MRGRARVALGRAVGLRLPIERAEEVSLRSPVHVTADEEVEQTVAVEVEPGGGGAPARVGDACPRSNFLEAAAQVVEEVVSSERGDVDVFLAVVVVVADRGSHALE